MEIQSPIAKGVQFGVFELDRQAGELRKRGIKVRLQGQPFEVLKRLLETPGELVTRDDLRSRLWSADTFVDFDQGLNNSIQKIREALGDSAESPRFIETIPKRGYRFIGALSVIDAPSSTSVAATVAPVAVGRRVGRIAVASILVVACVAAFALAWEWYRRHPKSGLPVRALAVLPLENLSGDPSEEYFADGITDELITEVAQLRPLQVTSRTSIMRYKGTHKSLPEIGSELGVDGILEGTVTRAGGRVRITAQLIDARSDTHLWSAEYDREIKDIILAQREVAQDVAQQIRLKVLPKEQGHSATTGAVNPEAHDAYLKGLHFWEIHNFKSMSQALHYFQDSVSRDPDFAPAWAALANAYCVSYSQNADRASFLYPKALAAVQNALKLDPASAQAHTALACIHNLFEWNWVEGQSELQKAAELDPSYSLPHQWYSFILMRIGQTEPSLQQMKITLALDPVSLRVNEVYGQRLMEGRQYQDAITQYARLLELFPEDAPVHQFLADAYEKVGNFERAGKEFEEFLSSQETRRSFLPTCKKVGYRNCKRQFMVAETKESLVNLQRKRTQGKYVPAAEFAWSYLQLGDKEKAMYYLESAFDEHCSCMLDLGLPQYDELRSNPRFQKLIARVGLPQGTEAAVQ